MTTLHRVNYIDRRGFLTHEWFPTLFTANDRVNELTTLGMEGVDFEEVEVPWDHIGDLIHFLNNTPNSPNVKDGTMDSQLNYGPILNGSPNDIRQAIADTVAHLSPKPVVHRTNTAPALLAKAASIMEERGKQYDKPEGERSMGRAVEAFNAITGKKLSESEGWLLLQVLKDVRLWQRPGYHADSAEDCIAYSALKAEAKSKE